MPIKEIQGDKVEDEIKKSEYPISIIKFSATWCKPCSMATTMIKDLDQKGKLNDVMIYEIDIEHDNSMHYASRMGVRGVPLFLKMDKECNVLDQKVGVSGPEQFLELCKI